MAETPRDECLIVKYANEEVPTGTFDTCACGAIAAKTTIDTPTRGSQTVAVVEGDNCTILPPEVRAYLSRK